MGLSSSKDRSLSPCHKAALAAYSEKDKQRMHVQFCACCGKGGEHIHQDALMNCLHLKVVGEALQRAIWAAVCALAAERGAQQTPASGTDGIAFADVVLLKHRIERGNKHERASLARSMLQSCKDAKAASQLAQDALSLTYGDAPSTPPSHLDSALIDNATAQLLQHAGSHADFARALHSWPGFPDLFTGVVAAFPQAASGAPRAVAELLPRVTSAPSGSGRDALLLRERSRLLLASLLGAERRQDWELLFNSDIHGKSFASFAGRIVEHGPTIVVVRDKGGALFGGFAAEPWAKNGHFYGSASNFLFRLRPDFCVHFASGVNENFQWCGHKFKELPNGFGFGGQVGYYSLMINSDLDTGTSRATATYASPCLASAENFQVDTVEVWRVEPPSEEELEAIAGTAMDRFGGDKFLLEMNNKAMHSDAYRKAEPPIETD